ncbi:CheY-like superfamily, partial [Chytriomyces sp. MP71]
SSKVEDKLSGKTKVLVVDDNDINRTVLGKHLSRLGAEVTLAVNGQDALENYFAMPDAFSVILMDLEMPVMDGRQATVRIRQDEEKVGKLSPVPIIAVTGNARSEQIRETLACGITEVLIKPFSRQQVED